MTQEIIHEADLLLCSTALGVCIVFVYDIFISVRKAVHHNALFVALEDFVFLTGSSISFFMLFYNANSGVVRGYAVGGMILGMILYHKLLSQHLVFIMSTSFKKTIHLVSKTFKIVIKPVKIVLSRVEKIAKKVGFKAKVGLTVCIKSSKLTLCKHHEESPPGCEKSSLEITEKGRVRHGRNRHSKKSRSQTRISEKTE